MGFLFCFAQLPSCTGCWVVQAALGSVFAGTPRSTCCTGGGLRADLQPSCSIASSPHLEGPGCSPILQAPIDHQQVARTHWGSQKEEEEEIGAGEGWGGHQGVICKALGWGSAWDEPSCPCAQLLPWGSCPEQSFWGREEFVLVWLKSCLLTTLFCCCCCSPCLVFQKRDWREFFKKKKRKEKTSHCFSWPKNTMNKQICNVNLPLPSETFMYLNITIPANPNTRGLFDTK